MTHTPLEVQIGDLLKLHQMKLVLAESCTGGLVGNLITNIPGSSDYYLGSITAYANEAKEALLGVKHETLQQYGAVSRQTVLEMAMGVRKSLSGGIPIESMIGVSISGIAGPGGGMPGKPVGTVWFGLSSLTGAWAWRFNWNGSRIQNKRSAARTALKLVKMYFAGMLPPETY